jgi:ABC-2 type transport system permease protein
MLRYVRLLGSLARFSLLGEMAFRGNYLLKVVVEVLWLGLLLLFYDTIYARTSAIGGWTKSEYLFFLGCYTALEGLLETFVLGNCSEFAELVRTGELDVILLRPIDEQFLVSFRRVEWSSVPNVVLGSGLMIYGLVQQAWSFDLLRLAGFAIAFACAAAMAYSFLIMLSATAVWMVRNQSLYELWWLFTSLMRYPREIFSGSWAAPLGLIFTYLIPVLLVINVPARTMVKVLEPEMMAFMMAVAVGLVWLSRRVFRRALMSYRSASS